jgi:hypothetical protein
LRKRTGAFLVVAALSAVGLIAATGRSSEAASVPENPSLAAETSDVTPEASRANSDSKRSAHASRSAHPTAMNVGALRKLTAPKKTGGRAAANIPDLDAILEQDDANDAWTSQVASYLKEKLPAEADVRDVNVRCVDSFCRVVLAKPNGGGLPWHEINERVFEHYLTGESIFSTQSDGSVSTGFIYFAEGTGTLPMAAPQDDPDDV